MQKKQLTVLFIPHGGGPLPLLGDPGHQELTEFLKSIAADLPRPELILVISAHWEEELFTITGAPHPTLIYDYYGFPPESYEIHYPAPGDAEVARKLRASLSYQQIEVGLDAKRGFDHGMFVPLKIMYPEADIPCIQISLLSSLNPLLHIELGRALRPFCSEEKRKILVLGSGLSFHNMNAFFANNSATEDKGNIAFEEWLFSTLSDPALSEQERQERIVHWKDAPCARYCHPREEHLLPLHVCFGFSEQTAKRVFFGNVLGKKTSAYLF